MKKALFAWSGGKDSALALHRIRQSQEYEVTYLLTTISEEHQRITMHGVRLELLEAQALALDIPLFPVFLPEGATMAVYDQVMLAAFNQLKDQGVEAAIFGDIYLQDLRVYREKQTKAAGLEPVFPLWGNNTHDLVQEFMQHEFRGVLVSVCDRRLGKAFIGRELDQSVLDTLPAGVDPAGENGEYHSFVYQGPEFIHPVRFEKGEVVLRNYGSSQDEPAFDTRFWFQDLLPAKPAL